MSEIKSAKGIAVAHVDSIKTNSSKFSSVKSSLTGGVQSNKPTDAMRQVFSDVNGVCNESGTCLSRDVGRVLLMAEEFEKWDNQTVYNK